MCRQSTWTEQLLPPDDWASEFAMRVEFPEDRACDRACELAGVAADDTPGTDEEGAAAAVA